MRFSLALPALLAKSLVDARDTARLHRRNVAFGDTVGGADTQQQKRLFKSLLSREARSKYHAEMKLRMEGSTLEGIHDTVHSVQPLECYPKHADVGVLGCGEHRYCIESEISALGGVCIPENFRQRHAQELFNFTHDDDEVLDDNFFNVTYETYDYDIPFDFLFLCEDFNPLVDGNCTCEADEVLELYSYSCTSELCVQVPALCNQRESVEFCGTEEFEYGYASSSGLIRVCFGLPTATI
ncbi:MAG: hypothetical protein SGARI_002867 [Bacillariaceae sp.]